LAGVANDPDNLIPNPFPSGKGNQIITRVQGSPQPKEALNSPRDSNLIQ
jgi:hypothetical protein